MKQYRKIDIYKGRTGAWLHVASTTQSKTCKEAVRKYKEAHNIPLDADTIRAWFSI